MVIERTTPKAIIVARSFVIDSERGRVLASKRGPKSGYNPSLWEAQGGKCGDGEEYHEALVREIEEETGLLVEPIDIATYCEKRDIDDGKYKGMQHRTLFGISSVVGGYLRLSPEHSTLMWCTLSEFIELDLTPVTRNALAALKEGLRSNGIY